MNILYISSWFPYPPDIGCRIRAYNLLRGLAKYHDVTLLSFISGSRQAEFISHLKELCIDIRTVDMDPFAPPRLMTNLQAWLSVQPATVKTTFSFEMQTLTQDVIKSSTPDAVLALTYVMAPYALQCTDSFRILDVDNLMAPWMYEFYAAEEHAVARSRRWLAWRKFQRYEAAYYRRFDQCLVVSEQDRHRLSSMLSGSGNALQNMPHISLVPNGVDCEQYDFREGKSPERRLIYNGSVQYSANLDAVTYFLSDIYPQIRRSAPEVTFAVTGATQGVNLDSLALHESVEFTGYVDDIRDEVSDADICVVPIRKGAGTRLKILEAMALGTPVVSTSKGAEGLDVVAGIHLLIADTPDEFAHAVLMLLADEALVRRLTRSARQLVEQKYDWAQISEAFATQIAEQFPVHDAQERGV